MQNGSKEIVLEWRGEHSGSFVKVVVMFSRSLTAKLIIYDTIYYIIHLLHNYT